MKFIKDAIYQLKRKYGFVGIIYSITSNTLDLDTGLQEKVITAQRIRKMILLPSSLSREWGKDQGSYDPNKRKILIENITDFKIKIGDYIVFKSQKFNIVEISKFEYDAAYILTVQADTKELQSTTFNRTVVSDFTINQEVIKDGP